jgi:hypothetical protein
MKKKLYIVLISVLAIVIVSSAFIPLSNNYKIEKGKSHTKVTQNHPDAGYIEEIGN